MLIYGNTPRDIMNMMWRRKFKLLTIIVVIAVAVMLTGCTGKQIKKPVKLGDGLNKFWDTLGGKVMTKSKDE
jgi:predicted small secreted protein